MIIKFGYFFEDHSDFTEFITKNIFSLVTIPTLLMNVLRYLRKVKEYWIEKFPKIQEQMLHNVTQEQKKLYLLLLLQLLMVDIIKDLYNINQVLERKNPIGLSAERKKYLSKEVSKYVQNPVKKFFYCNF